MIGMYLEKFSFYAATIMIDASEIRQRLQVFNHVGPSVVPLTQQELHLHSPFDSSLKMK